IIFISPLFQGGLSGFSHKLKMYSIIPENIVKNLEKNFKNLEIPENILMLLYMKEKIYIFRLFTN
ncbi:MAG: hypothetical protein QG635_2464, partial [Bacteroidota bacterium]|nr:hypothetical protein [Bacteroidota bacterium]